MGYWTNKRADAWRPMDDAPKDRDILLVTRYGLVYVGRYRTGNFGEPQQDVLAWRCSSSGRFADPTFWMDVPPFPAQIPF